MGRKKSKEPHTRTSFFLLTALKLGLEDLKVRDGVPESESVRRALSAYIEEKGLDLNSLKARAVKAAKEKK